MKGSDDLALARSAAFHVPLVIVGYSTCRLSTGRGPTPLGHKTDYANQLHHIIESGNKANQRVDAELGLARVASW
jgi:hypothetical protein